MAEKEDLKVLTTEFRVSHPHVFKPTKIQDGDKENYSIEMLFDKSITDVKHLLKPLTTAKILKWGDDKEQWPSPMKMPIRDGDKPYGKKKEVKPEHKGMWVVKASSSAEYSKPQVVGLNPKVELKESELYPGCYARASLKAHAYTFADKDGVKFIIDAVQFVRSGKAIGGRKPADQVFGVLEGADGDETAFDTPIGDDVDQEESFL